MKPQGRYEILAVPVGCKDPAHEELARKVNSLMDLGYEALGRPFFSEEMMYQAMIKAKDCSI